MNGMSFAYAFNHVITVAYTQTYVQITCIIITAYYMTI